jgi:hypothetical protein
MESVELRNANAALCAYAAELSHGAPGTLRALVRAAGMSVEEFLTLLGR